MKRKSLCLILALCCFIAAGCNVVEKENSPNESETTTSSSSVSSGHSSDADSSGSSSVNSAASSDQSSSSNSTSLTSVSSNDLSNPPTAEASSSTQSSNPQSSLTQSSKSQSSSTQSSKPQSSSTQSSKPQSSSTQSSKPQSSSTQSSTTSASSLPGEMLPPASVEIIGGYNQRAPEQWEIEFANEVFRLTNIERVKQGLPEFKRLEILDSVALTRAWEIIISYDHMRPNGSKFFTAVKEAGITYSSCGENIAAGYSTPEQVVNGWMNSPKHHENIMKPDYEYLSVGFYYDYDKIGGSYRYYWVQNFCALK